MASLGEVVGAIMSQISKGRSQADVATLEVAKAYKEHPLLTEFPVPRLTIDEVVIDLKMAIAASPIPERTLTETTRQNIITRLGDLAKQVPQHRSLRALFREHPKLLDIWTSGQGQLSQILSVLLPSNMEVEPQSIAKGAAAVFARYLTGTIVDPNAEVPPERARNVLRENLPQIETGLTEQIREIIVEALKSQPLATDRIEVLVTASELQNIPTEKITTMRLTLHESDRSWTQIETEKGETKEKLVPS